jgi:hypothetical protein
VIEAPGFVPQTLTALAVERRLVVVGVELLPMPARLQVSAPPAAHVFVDGVTWGEAPLPGPARVDPGEHIVTITAPGHRAAVRRVQLERGGSLDISVDRLEPTDQRFASRLVLAGAGGAALAAVATGVAAIVQQGRAIDGDPRRQPGATHADLVSFNSYVASRDEFRTASIALATGAGVLGVAGLMLHVLDTPQVPAPPVTVRAFDTAAPAGADPLEAP